jgi:hypothetical protein
MSLSALVRTASEAPRRCISGRRRAGKSHLELEEEDDEAREEEGGGSASQAKQDGGGVEWEGSGGTTQRAGGV